MNFWDFFIYTSHVCFSIFIGQPHWRECKIPMICPANNKRRGKVLGSLRLGILTSLNELAKRENNR